MFLPSNEALKALRHLQLIVIDAVVHYGKHG